MHYTLDFSCIAMMCLVLTAVLVPNNTRPEPVFPTMVSPKYSGETDENARIHTCLDQYNTNKASNGNAGLNWIQKGGGYYGQCDKKLSSRSVFDWNAPCDDGLVSCS